MRARSRVMGTRCSPRPPLMLCFAAGGAAGSAMPGGVTGDTGEAGTCARGDAGIGTWGDAGGAAADLEATGASFAAR